MTNPTKHPYAPELCALLHGEAIYVQDGMGVKYTAKLRINNPSAIPKVRLVDDKGNRIEGLLSTLINNNGYKLSLKPKDE